MYSHPCNKRRALIVTILLYNNPNNELLSPCRQPSFKTGMSLSRLGSIMSSGSFNCVNFQEQAFDQLVFHPEKKELARAVAHHASKFKEDDSNEDDNEIVLDDISNKGAAHLSFLRPSSGCSKTLRLLKCSLLRLCGLSISLFVAKHQSQSSPIKVTIVQFFRET